VKEHVGAGIVLDETETLVSNALDFAFCHLSRPILSKNIAVIGA
jgi:hypothetical protein